jgi:hypothetical protein
MSVLLLHFCVGFRRIPIKDILDCVYIKIRFDAILVDVPEMDMLLNRLTTQNFTDCFDSVVLCRFEKHVFTVGSEHLEKYA